MSNHQLVFDQSINGHTVDVVGDVTGTGAPTLPGVNRLSYNFDGESHVRLPAETCHFGTDDFSIDMWINVEPSGLIHTGTEMYLMVGQFAGTASTQSGTYWILYIDQNGYLSWQSRSKNPTVGVDTEFNIVGNTDMRRYDREWQHVVACRHQGVLALYLDGALQGEQTPDPQYDFSDPSLTLPCKVGRGQWDNWPSPLPSSAFVGVMQNLRIVKGASVYIDEFDLSLVDREFI